MDITSVERAYQDNSLTPTQLVRVIQAHRSNLKSHCSWKNDLVTEGGLEPPADEAYETSALPTELFRDWQGRWDSNPRWRIQSPLPWPLGDAPASRAALVPPDGSDPSSAM